MYRISVRNLRLTRSGGVIAAVLVGVALPVLAQGNGLAMLGTLAKGEWTIKYRDGSADRKICVRTGQELIQLRHRDAGCNQFVVEDGTAKVTVQYTCSGNGYGRTSIRREAPALVQIESQGIHDGMPFQLLAAARRSGTC
jgi:hypothetical protein